MGFKTAVARQEVPNRACVVDELTDEFQEHESHHEPYSETVSNEYSAKPFTLLNDNLGAVQTANKGNERCAKCPRMCGPALAIELVWPRIASSRIRALPHVHTSSQGSRPSLCFVPSASRWFFFLVCSIPKNRSILIPY